MRRYIKIFAFIILMFLSTNVYAYNWCSGGTGNNTYDICSYPWLTSYSQSGSSYFMGTNNNFNVQNDLNFFKDITTVGINPKYDTVLWHDSIDGSGNPVPNSMREQNRAKKIETIDYNNVSITITSNVDYMVMVYGSDLSNGFYSNIHLIKNDAFANTFNSNVKVESQIYKVDTGTVPYKIKITVITTPVISSTGGLTGKTNKILVIEQLTGISHNQVSVDNFMKPSSADRKKFTDKNMSQWPTEIYVKNANVKSLSTTQNSGDVVLSTNESGNWCSGGIGINFYDICDVIAPVKLKDLIKATINNHQNAFEFIPSSLPKVGKNTFVDLVTFDNKNNLPMGFVDPNKVLFEHPEYVELYNNSVKSYSLSYTNLKNRDDYINITLFVTPIILSNGSISTEKSNRIVYIESSMNIKITSIGATLTRTSLTNKFFTTNTSSWPQTLYLSNTSILSHTYTTESYNSTIYSTVTNVDTNWCKGGIGKNAYDFCSKMRYADKNEFGIDKKTDIQFTSGYKRFYNTPTEISYNNLKDIVGSVNFRAVDKLKFNVSLFINSDGSLFVFGCPNGVCKNNSALSGSSDTRFEIYTNYNLLVHPEYRKLFDSKVQISTRKYYSGGRGTIVVTTANIPIIESDGSIEDTQLLIEIHNEDKNFKKDNYYMLSEDLAKFIDLNSDNWPEIIYTEPRVNMYDKNSTSLKIGKDTSRGGSTLYYRDGFNSAVFDIETSECGGISGIKQFVEDYLIKALHIVAPILLFVLTTLDFVKGVFAGQKELNKAVRNVAKRALVCIILYFAGNIINILMDLAGIESCDTVDTDGDIVESIQYDGSYDCSYFDD